jgi:hypothetical protein
MIWERYYRGDRTYRAVDLLKSNDGLISIVMNGAENKTLLNESMYKSEAGYAYARLITLNARGILFYSEDYLNARGAYVSQMIRGSKGERVLAGYTMSEASADELPQEEYEALNPQFDHSMYGWVIAVPANDPYDDPCQTELY